ncbi:hypothetical protein ACR79P_06525 [Sphingobacterium spiritivorum]|uniref:hypothetical protein n=1 Tax=Sphingobacterium spiritivorum TaxID=258 RepID=UPI003DA3F018
MNIIKLLFLLNLLLLSIDSFSQSKLWASDENNSFSFTNKEYSNSWIDADFKMNKHGNTITLFGKNYDKPVSSYLYDAETINNKHVGCLFKTSDGKLYYAIIYVLDDKRYLVIGEKDNTLNLSSPLVLRQLEYSKDAINKPSSNAQNDDDLLKGIMGVMKLLVF